MGLSPGGKRWESRYCVNEPLSRKVVSDTQADCLNIDLREMGMNDSEYGYTMNTGAWLNT